MVHDTNPPSYITELSSWQKHFAWQFRNDWEQAIILTIMIAGSAISRSYLSTQNLGMLVATCLAHQNFWVFVDKLLSQSREWKVRILRCHCRFTSINKPVRKSNHNLPKHICFKTSNQNIGITKASISRVKGHYVQEWLLLRMYPCTLNLHIWNSWQH